MKELYLTPESAKSKIPIYVDKNGDQFVFASLGISRSLLYRQIQFLEDGELLFYGTTYRESEVEIIKTNLPKSLKESLKELPYKGIKINRT